MSGHERSGRESQHGEPPRRASGDSAGAAVDASPAPSNQAMTTLLSSVLDRAATREQGAGPLDDGIAAEIESTRGNGSPLDESTKFDMESHLGVDLSNVRVHTDGKAAELSRSVQAKAFTTGTDLYFSPGTYDPKSNSGRELLAHELTHAVQQSVGTGGEAGTVSHPDDAHEVEASAVGRAVASSPIATSDEAGS